MHLNNTAEFAAFRGLARTWIEENKPTEPRPTTFGPELREYDAAWQRRQFEGGWSGIDWEPEYGGRGLSLFEQIIWYEELVRAGAPMDTVFTVAFGHAGPTLIARGTEAQKSFFLPRILRGETPWCQGFSEPNAGSDLASLQTKGVIDGDEIVITGQKTWTSYGQWSDYGELLVRTDPEVPKHKGLTWLVMDMHLPGVDVRPITSIDGFPHNCEVFYDEVRVPLANVVGGVNNGWSVALSTLAAERGPAFLDQRLGLVRHVDDLVAHAKETGKLRDESIRNRLAEARAAAAAVRSMAYLQVSLARKGEQPSSETTSVRTFYTELTIEVARLGLDIVGVEALEMVPDSRHWLSKFSATIAGGTKDIQKNIIGERVLGLPR
ncbi:acyl-CoA dehydrogenase family protein [Nocardioides sp. WS12]|uniref:acyl-CoA dehydrogenase family protein n=1 Tax=Nocardioides sp. WS12 TaxID=2486272 RepID=UPI0015FBCBFF|nr:acyl-CoA dehydrogenase family protein [Nocardioides sp. WS12]